MTSLLFVSRTIYFHVYNVEQLPVEYLGKGGNC